MVIDLFFYFNDCNSELVLTIHFEMFFFCYSSNFNTDFKVALRHLNLSHISEIYKKFFKL